ncbi:hypothetical protein OS493_034288 [Desmophyllum pertusum]|uniref:Uncharacterized protein n=1 Tax=Desmophyllum pertusum TaxID=174260 RepID=A0A9X0CQS8_9CNID|nr:hypothetical protein OS493_034288 [Desmophyllum pertusum]
MASPRVVLISGCSSGIGLYTALLLAKDPEKRFKVFATMRNLEKKTALESEGRDRLGETLIVKQMDVSSDESVTSVVEELVAKEGRIDILINNAGVGCVTVLECMTMQQIKEMFDVNFFGAVRLIQAVLPGMKARQDGYIVNVSSVFGVTGGPFNDMYTAAKFAMGGLTESLAPVLKQFNIKISLVEPGPVVTSFISNLKGVASKVDLSTADQKSVQLMQSVIARMTDLTANVGQQSEEIADTIKEILLSSKPHIRYLTNKYYGLDEANSKLSDLTGDKLVDVLEKRFFAN